MLEHTMLLLTTQNPHTIAAVAIMVNMAHITLAGTMLMRTRTIHQQQFIITHTQEVHSIIHILVRNITTQHILEARLERQTLGMLEQLEVLEVMANRAAW
jgi:hypothetical protein